MIKIEYVEDTYIKEVMITGHAMYADYGKDIVCAGVSSMAIFAFNLCYEYEFVTITQAENLLQIVVSKADDNVNKVLLLLVKMLQELEVQYQDNIEIIRR